MHHACSAVVQNRNCAITICGIHFYHTARILLIEDEEQHRAVRWALEYRASQHRGRAPKRDLPELKLRTEDRLEPTLQMMDVDKFDELGGPNFTPFICLFWRPAPKNERVYHRFPLICAELGISIETFSVDELHNVHLGIMRVFVGRAIWELLLSNVFGLPDHFNQSDLVSAGLSEFVRQLKDWYPTERDRRGLSDKQLTRINKITVGMIGPKSSPTVSTKGAGTKWLFYFTVGMLETHIPKLRLPEKQMLMDACTVTQEASAALVI